MANEESEPTYGPMAYFTVPVDVPTVSLCTKEENKIRMIGKDDVQFILHYTSKSVIF